MRLPALAALACAVLLCGAATALPPPPGKRVVTLTPKPGFLSEPSIAIDPTHPDRVLAAYQTVGTVAYSRDAGRTWHTVQAVPHDFRLVAGDVSVAFDGRGRALLCYIAFDRLGTDEYWAHDATRNGIFVVRSPDGGVHWERHAIAVDGIGRHRPGFFEDKPYLVADPRSGNFYIGWTEFSLGASRMLFSRSTDGGATWSQPLRITTASGVPRDDNGSLEGFDGAVGSDGTLYVVWQDGTHIVFAQSSDRGRTFSPQRSIVNVPSMYFGISGYEGRGGNGFPQIGIDPRTQRLFVTWSDYRFGGVDVFSVTSPDGGKSWSDPIRVNDDALHSGRDHLFQWLAVDPVTGDAYVIFDDRRGTKRGIPQTLTLARSTDGGRTYRNYAWTSTPFDPRGQFMGDYNGIAAYGGRVYGVWTEAATVHPSSDKPMTIVRVGMARF